MASGYKTDNPGGSGHEQYGNTADPFWSRGPADPHSNRSISFDAMKDPGVYEGTGETAAKGAFKGGPNTKNA